MKNRIAGIVMCFFFAAGVSAQDDWHTYPFREVAVLVQQEQKIYDSLTQKAEMVISAKPFPSKTLVTYTGVKRPLSSYAKSYIRIWFESRNPSLANTEVLVEEWQFKEKGKEHWLPVLKNTAALLSQRLQPGDEIMIYYFYLGGFNPRSLQLKSDSREKPESVEVDAVRWIFAVEKFEKPRTDFVTQPLDSAVDRTMEADGKISDIWLDPREVKIKAKVAFAGDVREVPEKRRRLRDLWLEKKGFPPGASELMQNEGRFREGDKEYWIILRNRTLEQIQEIVKKGESVFLNAILVGGVRNGNRIDWVFVAGEYSR